LAEATTTNDADDNEGENQARRRRRRRAATRTTGRSAPASEVKQHRRGRGGRPEDSP